MRTTRCVYNGYIKEMQEGSSITAIYCCYRLVYDNKMTYIYYGVDASHSFYSSVVHLVI